jgi:hypothetical protein
VRVGGRWRDTHGEAGVRVHGWARLWAAAPYLRSYEFWGGGGHDACRSLGRRARRLAAASSLSWHRDSSGDPLLSPRRVMEAWAAGQPWRT